MERKCLPLTCASKDILVLAFNSIHFTVNVLKLQTLKKIITFSDVRNFRNYFCEKMLVFEILECGLYHEKKKAYMHVRIW